MQIQQKKLQHPLTTTIFIQPPTQFFQQNKQRAQPGAIHLASHKDNANNKSMQTLVKEMRFREKMQIINSKKGRYKRSTNNCHKKYIGILKNLLFLKLSNQKKDYIISQYRQFRNSRVYYFINLSYLMWCLDLQDIRWIYTHFCAEVQNKIERYKLEISMTDNENFINFRKDQIIQMQYSVQAINHFLRGRVDQSIRVLYQKNKYIIIKKNQYIRTTQIVHRINRQLEIEYANIHMPTKLSLLNLQEISIDCKNTNRPELSSKREQNQQSMGQDNQQNSINKQSGEKDIRRHKKQCVKIEEQYQCQAQPQYPLLGLQNSYELMSQMKWHSWIIQKQKMLEFVLRTRQQRTIRNIQEYGKINSQQKSQK